MSRTKKFIVLILTAVLVVFLCTFPMLGNARASAAEVENTAPIESVEPPISDDTTDGEETDGNGLQTLVNGFLAQLKAKYGDEYESYYNAIVGRWGSVEEYLLSLVNENTPDAVATGWTAFVKWLGEYAPVWGSILAVALVIVVILFGRKALNKIVNWVTSLNGKFKTLFAETNKIDAVLAAQNTALIKLLGENERFSEEREALEKTAEEIKEDGKV